MQDELVRLRRDLHQNPETGWKEYRTSESVKAKLEQNKFSVVNNLAGGTGLYTDIPGKDPSQKNLCVAWRADIDALPIDDEKEVPYKSQIPGKAHMCGHDVHTTVAYGIARLLKEFEDVLPGTVRVFWQPAEEVQPSGAPAMIEDGVLNNVSAVFGMHCDPHNKAGYYSLRRGAETAAFDSFRYTIRGSSTQHSARPHKGPDAMWVGHQLVQNLYQFTGRMIDAREATVMSVCMFNGGDALNVIPRKVEVGGTVRTIEEGNRASIVSYLKKIGNSLAELHGVSIDLQIGLGAPAVYNDERLFNFAHETVAENVGNGIILPRDQSMGAEDFAFYSQQVPSLFLRVGTSNGPETSHPLHSSLFDVDESVLAPTAAMGALLLINRLAKM